METLAYVTYFNALAALGIDDKALERYLMYHYPHNNYSFSHKPCGTFLQKFKNYNFYKLFNTIIFLLENISNEEFAFKVYK